MRTSAVDCRWADGFFRSGQVSCPVTCPSAAFGQGAACLCRSLHAAKLALRESTAKGHDFIAAGHPPFGFTSPRDLGLKGTRERHIQIFVVILRVLPLLYLCNHSSLIRIFFFFFFPLCIDATRSFWPFIINPSQRLNRHARHPTVTTIMASKTPIPQNDNVAHALAGAGGGILSMILTYE